LAGFVFCFVTIDQCIRSTQITVCCADGAPSGFIRVGSTIGANSRCPSNDPQILNLCSYVRYDNLEAGSKLKVCADAPTPVGWTESDPFTDLYGCDAQKYSGSARNEKWIQKPLRKVSFTFPQDGVSVTTLDEARTDLQSLFDDYGEIEDGVTWSMLSDKQVSSLRKIAENNSALKDYGGLELLGHG
jgi:hypothetical protein